MRALPVALAIPALLAAPALAQPAETPSAIMPSALSQSAETLSKEDVVVTGRVEAPPAEVRRQANRITRVSTKYRSPLAMFKNRICPGIVGMPAEMAEIMVDRIRYNAERIGIQTARLGDCQPNIMVMFVRNGQGVIRELQKKKHYLFRAISNAELRELAADPGPVHAWVNTEIRSRQGDTLMGDKNSDLTAIPVLNVGQAQSHIFLAHRIDITNSIIMIDLPAVDGMSVVQLADYVTMRAFARTNPVEGDVAATTILSLFDESDASSRPYELTDFDLAYLRAVYGGTDGLNAASKLAAITRELRDIQAESQTISTPAE